MAGRIETTMAGQNITENDDLLNHIIEGVTLEYRIHKFKDYGSGLGPDSQLQQKTI